MSAGPRRGGGGGRGAPPGPGSASASGAGPGEGSGSGSGPGAAGAGSFPVGLEQRPIWLDPSTPHPLQPRGPAAPPGPRLLPGNGRGRRALPPGFLLPPVADVPARLPPAARHRLEHRRRLGLRPALGADAAGPGAAPAPPGARLDVVGGAGGVPAVPPRAPPRGGAVAPGAGGLLRGPPAGALRHPPAGGAGARRGEEGRRLVRALHRRPHPQESGGEPPRGRRARRLRLAGLHRVQGGRGQPRAGGRQRGCAGAGAGEAGRGAPQPRLRGGHEGAAEAQVLRGDHRGEAAALPLLRRLPRQFPAVPGPPLLPALRGHLPRRLPLAVLPLQLPPQAALRQDGPELRHRLLRAPRARPGGAVRRAGPRAGGPPRQGALPHVHRGRGPGAGARLGGAALAAPPAGPPPAPQGQKKRGGRLRPPLRGHSGTPPPHRGGNRTLDEPRGGATLSPPPPLPLRVAARSGLFFRSQGVGGGGHKHKHEPNPPPNTLPHPTPGNCPPCPPPGACVSPPPPQNGVVSAVTLLAARVGVYLLWLRPPPRPPVPLKVYLKLSIASF